MIKLYQREGCPFCKRVRTALDSAGIAYYGINVPKLGSERKELMALDGVKGPSVPVLTDGDVVLQDTEEILAYVAKKKGEAFGDPAYALTRKVEGRSFDEVVGAAREALSAEGFGVLTEIDVKATLRKKLDTDFRDYLILGACNPPLAHQALTHEPGIGVLLPCNVVVASDPDGAVVVSAIDPIKMFGVIERDELEPIAKDVKQKLARVLAAI